ncbi:Rho GTPase-activating protein 6, partial [Halocaridina rubra]
AEQSSSAVQKKRRPYLLKRKALTTGFFDSKKEETKEGVNSGLVFGLSLTKCLENERSRSREAAERAAVAAAAAAAAAATSASSGTEETDPPLSRKSSHAGSQASFSSLIEGTKQSTTGSLESLNLERKRPSLVGADFLPPPGTTSPDLLTVEPSPQIPSLLHSCFKHLETNGMRTLGIFRVSSSKKRVRQLREEFDSGREVYLNEDHCPHDVATLLKEFFRDLPEPLLTRELYEPLIKTQSE